MNLRPEIWQPINGCSYASSGCTNCKALALAGPKLAQTFHEQGVLEGELWTSRVVLNEAALNVPIDFMWPVHFVVCPYGDLFHENVSDAWLERIFDIMESCPWHTFSVLTKRAAHMNAFYKRRYSSRHPTNIRFGVSVEDQKYADMRLAELVNIPRFFVTVYPMLGQIDLTPWLERIYLVGVGEETERPAEQNWSDDIRESCLKANIPYVQSSKLIGITT